LALTLWRIIQRIRDGAPKSSRNGPVALRLFTVITHVLIYVLLIGVPLAGVAAWFFSIVWAASLHQLLEQLLLVVIALHVAGALVQQFWIGNNVIMRMIGRV
jgi:cytochrome b561